MHMSARKHYHFITNYLKILNKLFVNTITRLFPLLAISYFIIYMSIYVAFELILKKSN